MPCQYSNNMAIHTTVAPAAIFKKHKLRYILQMHHAQQCAAEMVGAGASMATHNNCIYVFGGMDEDRAEHMYMWKWDLSSDMGFEPVAPRYKKVLPLTVFVILIMHSCVVNHYCTPKTSSVISAVNVIRNQCHTYLQQHNCITVDNSNM